MLPHVDRADRMRMAKYDCADCGVSTIEIGEYYALDVIVWMEACRESLGRRGGPSPYMLCATCVEWRLGRKLCPKDFNDAPCNVDAALCSAAMAERIFGASHEYIVSMVDRWSSLRERDGGWKGSTRA